MKRGLAALLGLVVLVPGAVMSLGDFRARRARLWVSGGVIPLVAERDVSPGWFWAFTAVNAALLTMLILFCAVVAVLP